jgi:hypothetical protein
MAMEKHSLKEFAENFIGPQRTSKWRSTLAGLKLHGMEELTQDQWDKALSDARIFLSRSGSVAHSLGWNAADMFCVCVQNDGSPTPRVLAVFGLSFAIQGGEVIMLTADSATIREKEGGLFFYLRSAPDGAGLIYNVQPTGERMIQC